MYSSFDVSKTTTSYMSDSMNGHIAFLMRFSGGHETLNVSKSGHNLV